MTLLAEVVRTSTQVAGTSSRLAKTRLIAELALRFARLKAYRPDKRAEEADTIETVRRIYGDQRK